MFYVWIVDIHLHNILAKLLKFFDQLSIDQFYEKYGNPRMVTIKRCGGKLLSSNIPPKAVLPLYLGKRAKDFKLSDVRIRLSNVGEAFALEAQFESQAALSYSADIWSLATVIWQIIGKRAISSTNWASEDEMVSQHNDVLGPIPEDWWNRWEKRDQFFDQNKHLMDGRDVWPSIDQGWPYEYILDVFADSALEIAVFILLENSTASRLPPA
ncbi:hypothetical protein ACJ72_07932 [Emergomyces africanus]|uniref:Protein kinase domain-containing protein n=1 Tax=Emergomyces africanus TaxID=1955775 RepID=A0A1B7NM59_9EURO|nr:hypothetical protein ACJ72_07932 [Emergomyces africanus]